MKRLIASGSLLVIAMLLVVSASFAAPLTAATSKTLSTNYTLVNLDTADAVVNVQYVTDTGAVWDADNANESFTVPGSFGQKIVAQYFDTTMAAGKGSAVISSSAPLSAVVQILARNQTPSSGAYSGFSTGSTSTSFYVPLVQRQLTTASGTSNAQIMIQNVTGSAILVDVEFIPAPGIAGITGHIEQDISIPAYATKYYDLSDETDLEIGWTGSAVVTASGAVAVVANLFAGPNTLTTYNAFAAEKVGTTWALPQFTSRLPNGLSTSISVQNVSGSTMAIDSISMDCTSSISTPATFTAKNSKEVVANASYSFNPVADMTLPSNWSGACIITAPGDVVVIATLRRPGYSDDAGTYEAFLADSTDSVVVIPLMSKRQANGFATVATIQNLDTVNTADVKLTFTPAATYTGSQTPIVLHKTIPPGGNIMPNLRFSEVPEIPDGWYGTLVVEPDDLATPRPLVGYVQLTNILGLAGDTLMCHDAISMP